MEARKAYGRLPLYFIENRGQVDNAVKFYEKGARHATFFTEEGIDLSLMKARDKTDEETFLDDEILGLNTKDRGTPLTGAVSLSFKGARKATA